MQHRVPIRLGSLRATVRDAPATDLALHVPTTISSNGRGNDAQALFAASAARVCRVCAQNAARYTCPRCNAPYCSAACYKRHGDACTEQFFEAHVRSVVQLESASGPRADAHAQRKVNDMLARVKRFQDESAIAIDSAANGASNGASDEDEDDDEEEALAWLEQLALADDAQLTLDALTPQQRKQFLAEVADGRLGKFVQLWQPWWLLDARVYERETEARRRQLVIQELSSSSSSRDGGGGGGSATDASEQPAGPVVIEAAAFPTAIFTNADAQAMPTSMDALLGGRAPSPLLRVHLVEILFSYALVLRTFNGEWQHDAADAATALLHLSSVLTRADATYTALEHVLHACLLKRTDADLDGGGDSGSGSSNARALNERVVVDVTLLLPSKTFVLDALSDARALVAAYAAQLRSDGEGRSRSRSDRNHRDARRRLTQVDRKFAFFLAWVFHAPVARLVATARELEVAASAAATGSE